MVMNGPPRLPSDCRTPCPTVRPAWDGAHPVPQVRRDIPIKHRAITTVLKRMMSHKNAILRERTRGMVLGWCWEKDQKEG